MIHRDLKPGNVILTDGEPVLIDFGIACLLDSATVTTSGAVLGTPGYLAPEILEGGETGPEADVFSLAATLAFAATGRHPYGTGPASAIGYRVVHHEPDLDGVPPWLEPLLRECLVPDPAARPPAAALPARLAAVAPVGRVAGSEGSATVPSSASSAGSAGSAAPVGPGVFASPPPPPAPPRPRPPSPPGGADARGRTGRAGGAGKTARAACTASPPGSGVPAAAAARGSTPPFRSPPASTAAP
nr:hypothetical protein GCM10020093_056860 [Planobispora longispora]